jgi:hypothetical protein
MHHRPATSLSIEVSRKRVFDLFRQLLSAAIASAHDVDYGFFRAFK